MLEILILAHFWRKVGLYARERGRKAIGYQLLLIAMWFGMEFIGGAAGYILTGEAAPAYLFGVAGAVIGLIAAITIIKTRCNLRERVHGFAVMPAPVSRAGDAAP